MAPTYGNGKICYLEIPAQDIQRSAEFYSQAFGWKTRTRSDGHVAFDDGVGEVSGSWAQGRKPMPQWVTNSPIGTGSSASSCLRIKGQNVPKN